MSRETQPEALPSGVLTAADVIAWRCAQAGVPVPQLPATAVLTHQGSLLGRRRPWNRDASLRCLSFEVRRLQVAGQPVVVAGCRGVGAPATAVAIEELATVGVRRILAIDIAGSLDPGVRSGDIVVVERVLSGDGTSPHYTRHAAVEPSAALTDALSAELGTQGVSYRRGVVWTTDAVYRETPAAIAEAREQGAVLADMETAATLAVARALGIEAAALLVAADELFDGWRPPAATGNVNAQLKRLLAVAPACLLL